MQSSSEAGEGGASAEQSGQSAVNVQQWSSTRLWKSALSVVLKGWIRQEIVTQFKLAVPVVSVSTKGEGGTYTCTCSVLTPTITVKV